MVERIKNAPDQGDDALYRTALDLALEANACHVAAARILDCLMEKQEDREKSKEKNKKDKSSGGKFPPLLLQQIGQPVGLPVAVDVRLVQLLALHILHHAVRAVQTGFEHLLGFLQLVEGSGTAHAAAHTEHALHEIFRQCY